MFLAFTSEARAAGAARALALSIKIYMNSWKKLLFGGAIGAGASASTGLGAGGLMAGLSRRMGDIVERRRRSREWRQKKRGKIFFAFQTGWLNHWVRAFRIVKAG